MVMQNRGTDSYAGIPETAAQAASTAQPGTTSGVAGAITDKLKQSGIDVERMKNEAQNPANKQAAEQKAREAADASAKTASRASLFGFVALILGAGAGAIGGRMGRPRDALSVR